MERIDQVAKIINSIVKSGSKPFRTWDIYPQVPDDRKEKVFKVLYKYGNVIISNIAAIYDTSLLHDCTNGYIFTSDGVYYLDLIGAPYYFNYGEILSVGANKTDIAVTFKDNSMKILHVFGQFSEIKRILNDLTLLAGSWNDTDFLQLKGFIKKRKPNFTKEQKKRCNAIIHSHAAACAGIGAGLAQLPGSDSGPISIIQVAMVSELSDVFELNLAEGVIKGMVSGLAASFSGRFVSQILVGWIPGVGNAINTATAAGLTEAVGWAAAHNFSFRREQEKAKYSFNGAKEGAKSASIHYERKMKELADEFLSQTRDWKKEKAEYEKLLTDYDKYINDQENNINELRHTHAQQANVISVLTQQLEDERKKYRDLVNLSKKG